MTNQNGSRNNLPDLKSEESNGRTKYPLSQQQKHRDGPLIFQNSNQNKVVEQISNYNNKQQILAINPYFNNKALLKGKNQLNSNKKWTQNDNLKSFNKNNLKDTNNADKNNELSNSNSSGLNIPYKLKDNNEKDFGYHTSMDNSR